MQQSYQSLNLSRGLWLPDAAPAWPLQAPLMLLLERLFFYRPLGGAAADIAVFADDAVWVGINPVIDDDCEFLAALMADVAVHGEEFLLGQLSLMTSSAPGPETAVSRLTGQLRRGTDVDAGREAERERISRARLLLALADLHRRQEEEVARGMARAEAKHRELMGALTAAPVSSAPGTGTYGATVNYPALLAAWFVLRGLDTSTVDLLACCADTWAVFPGDNTSEPLFVLDMPLAAAGEDPGEWIRKQRRRFSGLLETVAGVFAAPESLSPEAGSALARQWHDRGGDDCRGRLALYRLADIILPGGGDDKKKGKHGLIAVLSQR